MKTKRIAVLLALLLLFSMLPYTVSAQDTVRDVTSEEELRAAVESESVSIVNIKANIRLKYDLEYTFAERKGMTINICEGAELIIEENAVLDNCTLAVMGTLTVNGSLILGENTWLRVHGRLVNNAEIFISDGFGVYGAGALCADEAKAEIKTGRMTAYRAYEGEDSQRVFLDADESTVLEGFDGGSFYYLAAKSMWVKDNDPDPDRVAVYSEQEFYDAVINNGVDIIDVAADIELNYGFAVPRYKTIDINSGCKLTIRDKAVYKDCVLDVHGILNIEGSMALDSCALLRLEEGANINNRGSISINGGAEMQISGTLANNIELVCEKGAVRIDQGGQLINDGELSVKENAAVYVRGLLLCNGLFTLDGKIGIFGSGELRDELGGGAVHAGNTSGYTADAGEESLRVFLDKQGAVLESFAGAAYVYSDERSAWIEDDRPVPVRVSVSSYGEFIEAFERGEADIIELDGYVIFPQEADLTGGGVVIYIKKGSTLAVTARVGFEDISIVNDGGILAAYHGSIELGQGTGVVSSGEIRINYGGELRLAAADSAVESLGKVSLERGAKLTLESGEMCSRGSIKNDGYIFIEKDAVLYNYSDILNNYEMILDGGLYNDAKQGTLSADTSALICTGQNAAYAPGISGEETSMIFMDKKGGQPLKDIGEKIFRTDGGQWYEGGLDVPSISYINVSSTALGITMTGVEHADGYLLYRRELGTKTWSIAEKTYVGTYFLHRGLKPGVMYEYRAAAVKTQSYTARSYSNFLTAKVRPDRPQNLKANAARGKIELTWLDPQDPGVKFRVVRYEVGKGKWVGRTLTGKCSYTDRDVAPGKVYYYRVHAYRPTENAGNVFSFYSDRVDVKGI